MSLDPLLHDTSMPTSWNYGSFYGNSRLYLGHQVSEVKSHRLKTAEKDWASEDYYRALNQYKNIHKPQEEKKVIDNEKAFSVILNDSPDKMTYCAKEKDDLIVLPRETVYMIDRVVRQRTSRARLIVKGDLPEDTKDDQWNTPARDSEFKRASRSVNYDSIEPDFKHTPSMKRSNHKDRSLSIKTNKRTITFEEWYR